MLAGGQVGVSTQRHGEPEAKEGESLVQPPETSSDDGRQGWQQAAWREREKPAQAERESGASLRTPGIAAEHGGGDERRRCGVSFIPPPSEVPPFILNDIGATIVHSSIANWAISSRGGWVRLAVCTF